MSMAKIKPELSTVQLSVCPNAALGPTHLTEHTKDHQAWLQTTHGSLSNSLDSWLA